MTDAWLRDLLAPRIMQDGVEVTPTRAILDFQGFQVLDDPAKGSKRIFNTLTGQKPFVHAATQIALPANTRSGNDFQANSNGNIASIDSVPTFVGMRFIDKDHATQAHRGVMRFTDVGSASTPAKWTRDFDADSSSDFQTGGIWRVAVGGGENAGKVFVVSVPGGFVLNTGAITFTAVSQLGTYNVRSDFGAAGNGTTDDTTPIANAIAAAIANGGGIVYFPKGTYSSNNITLSAATGVRLVGAGQGASIIKARQAGDIVTLSGCTRCGVEHLGIERRDSLFQTSGGNGINITNSHSCWTDSVRCSYVGQGVRVHQSYFTHLRGKTQVDHISAGGGAGALQFLGTNGGANANGLLVDWLHYEHFYNNVGNHVYRGNWAATTAYAVGDIVFSNDRFWECQVAGTSSSTGPSAIPGTDGASAYTTGVTDGTVMWRFLIGNSFIVNHNLNAHNLVIQRLTCLGPCTHAGIMWVSAGSDTPTGLTIASMRVEQTIRTAF